MMNIIEMKEYWEKEFTKNKRKNSRKNEKCIIYNKDELNKIGLSEITVTILSEIGFYTKVDDKYLNKEITLITIQNQKFLQLWYSRFSIEQMLCISLTDEKVYYICLRNGIFEKTLYNTNVDKYMQFCTIYNKIEDEYIEDFEDEIDLYGLSINEHDSFVEVNYEFSRKVIEEFKKIDNEVIHIGSYWVRIMKNIMWDTCLTYLEDLMKKAIVEGKYNTIYDAEDDVVINGIDILK